LPAIPKSITSTSSLTEALQCAHHRPFWLFAGLSPFLRRPRAFNFPIRRRTPLPKPKPKESART
jgi:hypothetical protein